MFLLFSLIVFFLIINILSLGSLKVRVKKLEKVMMGDNFQHQEKDHQLSQEKSIPVKVEKKKEYSEELISFISSQTKLNVSDYDIKESLLKNGWDKNEVTETMEYVNQKSLDEEGKNIEDNLSKDNISGTALIEWLQKDWLMKLGALLFLIGIGWFVVYAFANNWIGPVGRITLGLFLGTAILILGSWRMRLFKDQGAVLVTLGVATITITMIAAREMYGFFTPLSELLIIFLTTSFAAFSGVKYRSRALATLSLILGYTAPSLVGGINNELIFYGYLFVVSAATLWVAGFTDWRFLTTLSLAFVAWFSFTGGIPNNIIILFSFAVLYFVTNITAMVRARKTDVADVLTAVGLSGLLIYWILSVVPEVWQSIWTIIWAVLFVIAAFIVFKSTERKEPVYLYSVIALAMLGVATAMELSGAALVLAYTFEIVAIVSATILITGNIKRAQDLSALFVIPVVLSLSSFVSSSWQTGILHKDFFVLFSLSAVLLILGSIFILIKNNSENLDTEKAFDKSIGMVMVGSVYALVLLWLSLHAVYSREIATTVALVVYTLLGMSMYIKGKTREIEAWYISGGILLAFVVFRLLFVEAWRLDMSGRIIIFLLIGTLLVTTAFIGRSTKNKIE